MLSRDHILNGLFEILTLSAEIINDPLGLLPRFIQQFQIS